MTLPPMPIYWFGVRRSGVNGLQLRPLKLLFLNPQWRTRRFNSLNLSLRIATTSRQLSYTEQHFEPELRTFGVPATRTESSDPLRTDEAEIRIAGCTND